MNLRLGHLTRLVADSSSESDGKLLAAYLGGSQAAFRELVDRHGSLVFGLCLRILRHRQDAEDAFQAVFLVLARRAADVWPQDAVGSWLYGVAYRIALKARTVRSRHRGREHALEDVAQVCEPSLEPDVAEVVVRAIGKLPEVYRAAVVACDLQGLSRKDAARQLNWSEGTLSSRLARARQLLAKRLLKTGVTLPATGLATVLGTIPPVRAGLPETVMLVTSAAARVPAPVAALTQGVVTGMFAFKLKVVAAATLVLCAIGYSTYCVGAGEEPGSQPQLVKDPQPVKDPPSPPAKKPIEIEVRGNQLIITSDDKHVLDELARLARSSSKPEENVFKVIRIKNVKAEDVAKTLTEIFNGPQQKQQGQGGGLAAPTPDRIRVVADTSSNSIVVIKASVIDLLTIEKLLSDHIDRDNKKEPVAPEDKKEPPAAKQPKTFDLTIHDMKLYFDGKQEIGFYIDRYYPEFDDRGVPKGMPLAKDAEVLIDGKKGKITDLLPGDKVTVHLSPDNKNITKIELSLKAMKTQLETLEKEAETLRQRIQTLEKVK